MRILILSDTHISETTSIITGNGEKYTLNLEQAIKSFNYYNNVAIDKHCEMMIFAGDVFKVLADNNIALLLYIESHSMAL